MPPNLTRRLALPFRWLMLAGIAWSITSGALYLLAGPESAATLPAPTAPDKPARTDVDLEALLARNLFGAAGARPARTTDDTVNAVATQLPLELRGVFVADDDTGSAAIIAQRGQPGQLYNINATIAGSAILERVFPDRVILRRAGIAETLRFPDGAAAFATGRSTTRSQRDSMSDYEDLIDESDEGDYDDEGYQELYDEGPPGKADFEAPLDMDDGMDGMEDDSFSFYKDRLDADPEGALRSLGMTPVDIGESSGYRVDNLAQAPYLSQTGLQPGDVILSVNGRSVGDLKQDRLELDNVLAEGSARIEVQRGTRRFFVTASIP